VLKEMKQMAERHCGAPVTKAVVTVPAFFDAAQKQATLDACKIAGLDVLRLISEPTSAAIAYDYHACKDDKTVLIFDLGGGTLDVSIVDASEGLLDVKATGGDMEVGGRDFDFNLIDILLARI